MDINSVDILLIIILVIAVIASLIIIKRNKGKCAYCSHYDNCPFKKVGKNVK